MSITNMFLVIFLVDIKNASGAWFLDVCHCNALCGAIVVHAQVAGIPPPIKPDRPVPCATAHPRKYIHP